MTYDAETLYRLLPAIHRIRDVGEGEPLRQLIALIAEQVAVLEENLDQLYDDQFVETCADWVVPYIGSLIGYRSLHGVTPGIASPRAEVANTIAFRRRKGTASMLEQLARDVTGWPARVVEMFQHLATTQHMNHIRSGHAFAPDLRRWESLERTGGAFDSFAHLGEARPVEQAGRYNIPNVGVFLWRLAAYRLTDSPAVRVDARRFRIHPLGIDSALFSRPRVEDEITHLAEPVNVPEPISRRVLKNRLGDYYGPDLSIGVRAGGAFVESGDVRICDLSDSGGGWAHMPTDRVALDPVLGRLAFPEDVTPDEAVLTTSHYGFGADLGGGSYERGDSLSPLQPGQTRLQVPDDFATIQDALDNLPAGGVVEITDSGRYEETPAVQVPAGASVEIRAANEHRPTLVLSGSFDIAGGTGSAAGLNGLLVAGGPITVPAAGNELETLSVHHCTLVPGRTLEPDGSPQQPGAASLVAEPADLTITIDRCIVGALRITDTSQAVVTNSVVDATAPHLVAFAGPAGGAADPPGGELTLREATVIGKIYADRLTLVSNSILYARLAEADPWPAPVRADRKQDGCVRFTYLPLDSISPRRYRCQPQLAVDQQIAQREQELGTKLADADRASIAERESRRVVPDFTSTTYGDPWYAQLLRTVPRAIRAGADDESEMGAFHLLYQPQRETNLLVRFDEYLRFGLHAGVFYET